VAVFEELPDHRDSVLDEERRATPDQPNGDHGDLLRELSPRPLGASVEDCVVNAVERVSSSEAFAL
jgi:hypothetical protein